MKRHSCSTTHRKKAYSEALAVLKNARFKLTQPRKVLIKALVRADHPLTVEEAFSATQRLNEGARVDLVTVYRGLAMLEELGMVQRCDFGDGAVRFELMSDADHHHHHIICTKCKRVEPLTVCTIKGEEALNKLGYTDLKHRLEFFGVCPQCS